MTKIKSRRVRRRRDDIRPRVRRSNPPGHSISLRDSPDEFHRRKLHNKSIPSCTWSLQQEGHSEPAANIHEGRYFISTVSTGENLSSSFYQLITKQPQQTSCFRTSSPGRAEEEPVCFAVTFDLPALIWTNARRKRWNNGFHSDGLGLVSSTMSHAAALTQVFS